MSLKSRRILFAFFVLIFFTLVPIVLIYATGHTINWRRLSLEKTGTVLIDSEPSNASIFIDGRPVTGGFLNGLQNDETMTTSARLKNIAPGEHIIRLELYGYWPWEESFRLSGDEAVNFNIIHLFKQSKPELILETATKISAASKGGKYFALLGNEKIIIVNNNDAKINSLNLPPEAKIKDLQWSADEQFLRAGYFLIDVIDGSIVDLAKKNPGMEILRWNTLDSSGLWASKKNTLLNYSTISKSTSTYNIKELKPDETIVDFSIYGKQVFIVTREASKQENLLIGQLGGDLKKLELPGADNRFVLNGSDLPCLYSGHKLYVIDEPLLLFPTPRLVEAAKNFNLGEWINDEILYSTSLELRRWNKNEQDNLLTRFGSPILALKQLTKRPAIVVALPDSIRLFSDSRTSYILNISGIKNTVGLAVSTDENFIYALGEYEGRAGLYRLPL